MPAIIAKLVIKIGRSRLLAPSIAALPPAGLHTERVRQR